MGPLTSKTKHSFHSCQSLRQLVWHMHILQNLQGKWCGHFGRQFGNIHKIWNTQTLWSSNYTSQILSCRSSWTLRIFCSIVYSNNNLEKWLRSLIRVHPKDRIPYCNIMNCTDTKWKTSVQSNGYGIFLLSVIFKLYLFFHCVVDVYRICLGRHTRKLHSAHPWWYSGAPHASAHTGGALSSVPFGNICLFYLMDFVIFQ